MVMTLGSIRLTLRVTNFTLPGPEMFAECWSAPKQRVPLVYLNDMGCSRARAVAVSFNDRTPAPDVVLEPAQMPWVHRLTKLLPLALQSMSPLEPSEMCELVGLRLNPTT